MIIGIDATIITKIVSFFLIGLKYYISECNIYIVLLDNLMVYLSHLSSY